LSLLDSQRNQISELLEGQIRRKLANHSPETNNMPFHVRLLGRDRMALFSFIQSINTTLGTSVFEQVAAIIAASHFKKAVNQYKGFNNTISESAQDTIQQILDDLRAVRNKPSKPAEIEMILQSAQVGKMKVVKQPRIDLFLEAYDGTEYYFDLKTAKPNRGEIIGLKRTMLEWVAIRFAQNPKPSSIYTGLAIPYNPYEPEEYDRWTLSGMFDLHNEVKVAKEFWDFIGGNDTYEDLLEIFEKVGLKLRPEIDSVFAKFAPS